MADVTVAAVRRRAGRPSRELTPGERVPMSFRVRPELKKMMDDASAVSGRSVTQEVEFRLEQSFRDDRLLEKLEQIRIDLLKNSNAALEHYLRNKP